MRGGEGENEGETYWQTMRKTERQGWVRKRSIRVKETDRGKGRNP